MSTHPREPFDAEEARIKRAYDALPGGEPSAALDARVLAQARGALAAKRAPTRRRPWFLGAGLGTAAAAVFAAGIAWQLGVFEGDGNLSSVPAQAPAAQEEELDRIDIEFMKQERKKDEYRDQREFGAAPPPPPPAPKAPPAPPMPPPPPGAMQDAAATAAPSPVVRSNEILERRREADKPQAQAAEVVPEAMAEPQAFPAESQPLPDAAPAAAPAVAAPADTASAAPMREAEVSLGRDSRDRADSPLGAVSGARQEAPAASAGGASNRAGLAKEIALPPWAEDVQLAPDAWLERIRDRVQQGDRQGAEHSLRRFVLEHPQRRVPRDLQRLLVE